MLLCSYPWSTGQCVTRIHYCQPLCRNTDMNVEYGIAVSCGIVIDSTRHVVVYCIGCCVGVKWKLWTLKLNCHVLFINIYLTRIIISMKVSCSSHAPSTRLFLHYTLNACWWSLAWRNLNELERRLKKIFYLLMHGGRFLGDETNIWDSIHWHRLARIITGVLISP